MATDDKNVDNNAGLKRILYLDKEYRDTILFEFNSVSMMIVFYH